MFTPITEAQAFAIHSLPQSLAPFEGEHRGINFVVERRSYGQTVARMVGTSRKTGTQLVFSIGLAYSPRYSRPELRVDFLKRFERYPGGGRWTSAFDPKSKTHRAALKWAAEAFIKSLESWNPAPAGNISVQEEKPLPKIRVVKPRKGSTYRTKRGTLVHRRDHMAAVYQNAAIKTEYVALQ